MGTVDAASPIRKLHGSTNVLEGIVDLLRRRYGGPPRTLEAHTDTITCVAEVWHGTRLEFMSGSLDHSVRLWDVATGECELVLPHPSPVNCVADAGEGEAVVGCNSCKIWVWDIEDGERVDFLTGHRSAITCIVRLGGEQVVSGSTDKTMRVWDMTTRSCLHKLKCDPMDALQCVAYIGRGRIISQSSDHNVRVWDVGIGAQIEEWNSTDPAYCKARLHTNEVTYYALDQMIAALDTINGNEKCLSILELTHTQLTSDALVTGDVQVWNAQGTQFGASHRWTVDGAVCTSPVQSRWCSLKTMVCKNVLQLTDGQLLTVDDKTLLLWS